ncbi:unnamed protein product [Soboliphyme baturini]|uniref:Peptidase_M14 domain-containing protein n=1 Tax=Soboliphyme baturini TaxID=241478 RepID=A0A183J3A4_9BILA|nr:unnamed protein product [Soboliphyme baturini]
MPIFNPDGYEYSRTTDRMWRKSRSGECTAKQTKCCIGVDLNRNFDVGFGGPDSSSRPCAENYRGPEPFSEPETVAVRNFIQNNPSILAYFALHTYELVTGTAPDWVKSNTNIRFSYTIEMRPLEDDKDGFVLDPSEILPAGEELSLVDSTL